ncbi:hypothetical protein KY338_07080 [Candidatus Woesearchaeota archaeon]|nr:hypothetical protein [Candidatus Woesearchaeota archaeon]MBW3005836.1 hypothetical protein [Candidatus Woesearchaeota archaeon]
MKKLLLFALIVLVLFVVGCQPRGQAIAAGRQARAAPADFYAQQLDNMPSEEMLWYEAPSKKFVQAPAPVEVGFQEGEIMHDTESKGGTEITDEINEWVSSVIKSAEVLKKSIEEEKRRKSAAAGQEPPKTCKCKYEADKMLCWAVSGEIVRRPSTVLGSDKVSVTETFVSVSPTWGGECIKEIQISFDPALTTTVSTDSLCRSNAECNVPAIQTLCKGLIPVFPGQTPEEQEAMKEVSCASPWRGGMGAEWGDMERDCLCKADWQFNGCTCEQG